MILEHSKIAFIYKGCSFLEELIYFTIQTKMLHRDCTYENSTFYCFCLHYHTDAARKTKVEFLNNDEVTFWVK
jgi:hypothetical protein